MSEARPASVPSPQPAVLHGQPSPQPAILLRGRVYTTSRGRELLSSCNAIPLKTTTAARGGGARGTVAMPPGGGWVLPCLRRAGPEQKKSSHVLIAGCPRVPPPPRRIRAPKHNWQKWRRRSSWMRCHRLIARSWCAACKRHSVLALLRRCTALLSLPLPSVLHSRVLHAACSTQHAMQLSLPPHSPTHDNRWETSSTRMWSVSSASHWRPR